MQDAAHLAAPIARVTVHPNGALVERRATAPAGAHQIADLPLLFSSGTLRVRAERGRVSGLQETCTLTRHGDTAPDAHEADIITLTQKLETLRARARTIKDALKALQSVGPQPRPTEAPIARPQAQGWLSFLSLRDSFLERYRDEQRALQDELVPLQEHLTLLRQTKDAPRPAPVFTRGLAFALSEDSPVVVDYFVPAATWVPTYALHADDDATATLHLFAMVAQASGESWTDVDLAFSTAPLIRQSRLPDLPSWRIGRAQPAPKPAYRPLPPGLSTLFAAYDHAVQNARVVRDQPPPTPSPAPRSPPSPPPHLDRVRGLVEEVSAADLDDMSDDDAAIEFDEAPTLSASVDMVAGGPPPAAMAAAAPIMAQEAAVPLARRRAAKKGGPPRGAAGGAMADDIESLAADVAVDQRPDVNAAYLRMSGPDESRRGQLVAVHDEAFLATLLEDHQPADTAALSRAYRARQDAMRRLHNRPLPRGTVSLGSGAARTVFAPSRPATVGPDGTFHRVLAWSQALPSEHSLLAVPQAGLDVYRRCQLAPPAVPLPAGPLEVYERGAFLVSSNLSGVGGGEPIDLSLGVEPTVRLVDHVVRADESETGLVGKKARIETHVSTQVRSAKATPVSIALHGRLPVPAAQAADEVDVEWLGSSHEHRPTDRAPDGSRLEGGFAIHLVVEPGTTTAVTYRYAITLPAKAELVGGNRRD